MSLKGKALGSVLCILLLASLAADEETLEFATKTATPWFTGPLIAPSGVVVPAGNFSLQPYLILGATTGNYDSHWSAVPRPNLYNAILEVEAIIGLASWIDIQILPALFYQLCEAESSTGFGDLPIAFDFQIVRADKYRWFPGIKFAVTETFPTGKYQKLQKSKRGVDSSGLGSFSTAAALVFYKIYPFIKGHFLSMTASFEYTYCAPVHIQGVSVYRGNDQTRGQVYPGNITQAIISFEYSLTQHWALAIDNLYTHTDKDRFRGNRGNASNPAGRPSSESLSFAPGLEYNFNQNLGIIGGVWFTAAGRNSPKFCNGILSFNCSY